MAGYRQARMAVTFYVHDHDDSDDPDDPMGAWEVHELDTMATPGDGTCSEKSKKRGILNGTISTELAAALDAVEQVFVADYNARRLA